jgi:hypothetical protein
MYVTFFVLKQAKEVHRRAKKGGGRNNKASVKGNPKPKPKAVIPPEKPTKGTPEKTNKK